MNKPSVDILLPYWGEFKLLKETVESVITQTNSNWSLQVFDDCYPSDEAQRYFSALTDKRIKYYRHDTNIGITNNFNFALNAATAPYCVLIGCDDIMLPTYIETALQHVKDADFYQPSVEIIDEDGHLYLPLVDRVKRTLQPRKTGLYSGEKLATSLCHGNWLYFPSIMWKTDTIKRYMFDNQYKIAEDLVLELNIIKDGGVLSFDRTTTFQYRRFANSLSSREKSKGGVRFNEEEKVHAHFTKVFKDMGWSKAARAANIHLTSRIHQMLSS